MSDYNYWGDYDGEFGIGYELFGQYANSHLEIDELDYNLIPNSILINSERLTPSSEEIVPAIDTTPVC